MPHREPCLLKLSERVFEAVSVPALAVQLGSLVGDALWAVLGMAGVGLLLQLPYLQLPIGIVGVLYLLWLGYDSWSAASREF